MKNTSELEWDNSWIHPLDDCSVSVAKNNHPQLHAVVSLHIGGFGMALNPETARALGKRLQEVAKETAEFTP